MSFLSFGPMKSLFSFSTAQTEKNSGKYLGKTRLVVWWFDVTNKITHHKLAQQSVTRFKSILLCTEKSADYKGLGLTTNSSLVD